MNNLYNTDKRGTIIVTIGRSGSHLLGDIIEQRLNRLNIPAVNLLEELLLPDSFSFNEKYRNAVSRVDRAGRVRYTIVQVQDFNSKLWLLRNHVSWLNDYHVVVLKRRDHAKHFLSRQILENFWDVIPVHTRRGVTEGEHVSFDNLHNKKIEINPSAIWQFYSEQEILNRFEYNELVYYEDLLDYPESTTSNYIKNNYKINFEDLFTNYKDITKLLNNE